MYMLLVGTPPFAGNSDKEVLQSVERGKASYTGTQWKQISKEAICLLRQMLNSSPRARISADKALKSQWFEQFAAETKPEDKQVIKCVTNLTNFKAESAMKSAVLAYMSAHLIGKKKERKLKEIFRLFDADNNGQISLEELVAGYKVLYKDAELARKEAVKTMQRIDVNNNNTIDYNGKEFGDDRVFNGEFEAERVLGWEKSEDGVCLLRCKPCWQHLRYCAQKNLLEYRCRGIGRESNRHKCR
eukprot:TRINITY_DN7504_c0_g1_i2.p2 TRINITY_DN7504_c0_g1~~TRINITY_DN7504_c0_g1_i2.p2  ORF type:complete len:244 (+),score=36.21 TRINITY_DN7504_c0_g1_i2:704-1435(+)